MRIRAGGQCKNKPNLFVGWQLSGALDKELDILLQAYEYGISRQGIIKF
jgi:hypothetical protein